jgi:hypothetical protein
MLLGGIDSYFHLLSISYSEIKEGFLDFENCVATPFDNYNDPQNMVRYLFL